MAFQPRSGCLAGVESAAESTDFGSMFYINVSGCRGCGGTDWDVGTASPEEKVQSLMFINTRACSHFWGATALVKISAAWSADT
eukprot:3576704-Karenia_brevis.AAC.1